MIFVGWFFPGFKGAGQSTSCLNLVLGLHQDYDLYIFTRGNDYGVKEDYDSVKLNEWNDFRGIAKVYYCQKSSLSFSKVFKVIKEVNPMLIYINGMFSFNMTIIPILINRFFITSSQVILVPRGMLMDGKIQFKRFKKLIFIKIFKLLGLQKKLFFQATSNEEKLSIKKRLKANVKQIYTIPNIPSINQVETNLPAKKGSNKLKLYFASRIAREKNIIYALEVLKKLDLPVQFDIWGSIDHNLYWEKCKELINTFPEYIEVNYKGTYRPENMKVCFKNYHFFFFPTFGENYGHVIIEALGLGKPVIISPNTPWEDLEEYQAGWIISLDDKSRYQSVIQDCIKMNQEEYNSYSKSAIDYTNYKVNKSVHLSLYKSMFG